MNWALILDVLSWIFILVGGGGVVVGALGLVRFPDFYTRLHAAGVTDTAGAELIIIGLIFQSPHWLVTVKLLLIGAFLGLTSPVATHAVAHAAWMVGFRPLTGEDLTYDTDGE
ncbi:MAG: monovalent cation/H(+) antiporter subunit G [Pseudomonadota bacterium]